MRDPRPAYDGSADAWATGASLLYERLAECIVDALDVDLHGALVLDVGAGTGALCRALDRRGALTVALDASADMLAHAAGAALVRVTGDMLAMPFVARSFDAAVSAFAVSHVSMPERALGEMRRVVHPGGLVAVAVFGATSTAPSKDAVDDVLVRFGHVPPPWHGTLKNVTEPLTNTPDRLGACAVGAGLEVTRIDDTEVDSGLDAAEDVVRYRLGMAHIAPFVASLDDERRSELVAEAVAAVVERGQPLRPRVLILSSRAPA